jgi:2-oxoglutarate ferredoxin oxidoreductase subunit alpha
MKGNEAIGEAAIRAGCIHFFGYPITPQSEVPEYLAKRLPEVGGKYVQAESEVAASNMIYGAAGVGIRVLTTSSSPGVSLMSEGLSYLAGAELPVVLVNIMRGGPGLGGILPAQGDYMQATKGPGHGDFKMLVLAPASVQEAVNLVILAFELAEKYRNPVMVIGDGMIGQMMEPVEFPGDGVGPPLDPGDWGLTGCEGRKPRVINSLFLDAEALHQHNVKLKAKYDRMAEEEARWELYNCDEGYDLVVTAYGTVSRICKTAIDELREEGINVGLFRPITVFPFPFEQCRQAMDQAKRVLNIEMSMGQMLYDVRLAANGTKEIDFFGTAGGVVPSPEQIADKIRESLGRVGAKGSRGKAGKRKPAKKSTRKKAASRRTASKPTKNAAKAAKGGGRKRKKAAKKRGGKAKSSARRKR